MKLNFGCGKDIRDGYYNYDREIDLEKKLPFESNSADGILLLNVFEHINNRNQLIEECRRILKENGKLKILVPFVHSWLVGADIEHKLGFTFDAFRRVEGFKITKEKVYSFIPFLDNRIGYIIGLYLFPIVKNIEVEMRKR